MSITPMDKITKNLILPLLHERSLEGIDHFCLPHTSVETTLISGSGPDVLKRSVQEMFAAFPNITFTMEDIFQNKQKVVYEWQASATHEGSILGIPKTGRSVNFKGMVLGEIQNGLLVRYTSYSNTSQVLRETYATSILDPQNYLKIELGKITQSSLTKRETETLCCWVRGCSIKETAKHMGGLSARTIQTYRENIKKKFNIFSFQKIFSLIQNHGIMPLFLEGPYAAALSLDL